MPRLADLDLCLRSTEEEFNSLTGCQRALGVVAALLSPKQQVEVRFLQGLPELLYEQKDDDARCVLHERSL